MNSFSGNTGQQPTPVHRDPMARPQQRVVGQPINREPVQQQAPRGPEPKTPGVRKTKLWVALAIVLIVVVIGAGYASYNALVEGRLIDASKYQAVFLTNGQVYFGKLSRVGGDTYRLNKVFYLQASQTGATDANNPQKTGSANSDVQLIKLGSEVHGPDDQMAIDKGQVLFYENLTKEGKVAQTIEKYYASNK